MVVKKSFGGQRPTVEDLLRAVAYLAIMAWTIVFLVFPPVAYQDEIDVATRITWMGITFLGAGTAFLGSIFRFDLKVELPGLVFALIGPLFYFAAQVYFVSHPEYLSEQMGREHLVVYAALPILLTLPRIYALYAESRRQKRINLTRRGK